MMSDFVSRYRDRDASTDDFREWRTNLRAHGRRPAVPDASTSLVLQHWVYQTGSARYRGASSREEALAGAVLRGSLPG